MTTITFDPTAFRLAFPRFNNTVCAPNSTLTAWFDTACLYISPNVGGCSYSLTQDQQAAALNLLTAHVGYLWTAAANGQPTAIVTDAAIDKVKVTVKAPPIQENSMFQFWLAQSPFGIQLLAMLGMQAAGGMYVGGAPERGAFRRVGGGFGPSRPFGGC